jgi:hypothetical protein
MVTHLDYEFSHLFFFLSFFLNSYIFSFHLYLYLSLLAYLFLSAFLFFSVIRFPFKTIHFYFSVFLVFFVKSEKVSLFSIFLDKRLRRTTFEHLLLLLANFGIRIPNYENVLMILLKRPCEADKSTNAVLENSYLN